MKNIKSKLLTIGVSTLTVAPLLSSCMPTKTMAMLNNGIDELHVVGSPDTESNHEACTITYVGKDVSATKTPIIARATDCNPKAVHLKLQHFKKDEIANKTLVGKLGLKYTMPEHTYAYTACPLSAQTASDPVWASGMWENNGINEMGVCTTSTLTTKTNPKVLALEGESFVRDGVGEELLTTIMTPQAATAKEAMKVAAEAIDKYGAQDSNIIMTSDQNEAWLMEIYSRHQYCAVKLPSDKMCIAGNEFILNSLDELGINAENAEENCILSPGFYSTVKDTEFVKYKSGAKDVYHLDIFNTYARPLTWTDEKGVFHNTDSCHMRTWRGYSLFDKSSTCPEYDQNTKYEPFLTPKDEDGNARNDIAINEVFDIYRDEFDELCNPNSPKYNKLFANAKRDGTLRTIAVQTTRQVHIMTSDANKPQWMAANEWYTPSSANYTPYLQFNAAMTSFDGEYGYFPERFEYDQNCASVLFRELNKLACYDRTHYGYPLQDFWRVYEYIYCQQMQQVTDDVAKFDQGKATTILNNFNKHVRDEIVKQVKKTTEDLRWHIMDQPQTETSKQIFTPLVDLENIVKELGWKNYKFENSKASFERGDNKCEFTLSSGAVYSHGELRVNTDTIYNLKDSVVGNKVYVDANTLFKAIGEMSEIRNINVNDYTGFNHLTWIIPTSIIAAGGAAVGTFFLIKNKKAHKSAKK